MISALDYPQQVGEPPVITQPDVIPGGQVHIPDSNLRTAIAEELGKSVNAPITAEDMKRLTLLDVRNKDIRDLTGLQFATNLWRLVFDDNPVADLSPIVGLINLRSLAFDRINQSGGAVDLSPIAGLSNLEDLNLPDAVDLSPLAGLSNLRILFLDTIFFRPRRQHIRSIAACRISQPGTHSCGRHIRIRFVTLGRIDKAEPSISSQRNDIRPHPFGGLDGPRRTVSIRQ